jgi:hypothetical protein
VSNRFVTTDNAGPGLRSLPHQDRKEVGDTPKATSVPSWPSRIENSRQPPTAHRFPLSVRPLAYRPEWPERSQRQPFGASHKGLRVSLTHLTRFPQRFAPRRRRPSTAYHRRLIGSPPPRLVRGQSRVSAGLGLRPAAKGRRSADHREVARRRQSRAALGADAGSRNAHLYRGEGKGHLPNTSNFSR